MCIFYGILPFFGLTAYLLYLFQPFASFCVTGTVKFIFFRVFNPFLAF